VDAFKTGLLLLLLSIAFAIGAIAAAISIERATKTPFIIYLLGAPTFSDFEPPTHLLTLYNVLSALFWATLIAGIALLVIGSLKRIQRKSEFSSRA